MALTPVALFDVDAALVGALEAALGPPIDSYLMGWQTWIVEVAGGDVELEFRLHPPAGFRQPQGIGHHDLWDAVVTGLAAGEERLRLGDEQRPLDGVWVLLEVYPAFGEPVTAEQVRGWAEEVVERPALAAGAVDHDRLGGRWKRQRHDFDLPGALRGSLGA